MHRAAASPFLLVLGIAQDAGYPQAGCRRPCCRRAWQRVALRRHAACLAIVDPATRRRWLIDATPDFREQLHALDRVAPPADGPALTGILLTHAHIGHYAGLIHLGREAIGARGLPVHAMPRMAKFLRTHAPWEQLVTLGNIAIAPLRGGKELRLSSRVTITPLPVPHRSEYTETVGYRIVGPRRSALWIPDIDRWELWERRVEDEIVRSDAAWLDGTFFGAEELPGRDMAEVPHPLLASTMERLGALPTVERRKVRFVHLNHTNPALAAGSAARREIRRRGFRVAQEGEKFEL